VPDRDEKGSYRDRESLVSNIRRQAGCRYMYSSMDRIRDPASCKPDTSKRPVICPDERPTISIRMASPYLSFTVGDNYRR
jgi:hypothetical protein